MLKFILNGLIVFQKKLSNREYFNYSNKVPGDIINGNTKKFIIKDIFIDLNEIRIELMEWRR